MNVIPIKPNLTMVSLRTCTLFVSCTTVVAMTSDCALCVPDITFSRTTMRHLRLIQQMHGYREVRYMDAESFYAEVQKVQAGL